MLERALEIVRAHGGRYDQQAPQREGASARAPPGQWRDSFIRMPYNREVLTPRGIITETFETVDHLGALPAFSRAGESGDGDARSAR